MHMFHRKNASEKTGRRITIEENVRFGAEESKKKVSSPKKKQNEYTSIVRETPSAIARKNKKSRKWQRKGKTKNIFGQ